MDLPRQLTLDRAEAFLRWVSSEPSRCSLADVTAAEIWALVGLAALARLQQPRPLRIDPSGSPASGFAHAVGLDAVVAGPSSIASAEPERTVRLARISDFKEIEPAASAISKLLLAQPELEEARKTVYYVLVELLRNVVQHSHDPFGAVVAAQRHSRGRTEEHPVVQVAVADNGIGIPAALNVLHKDAADPPTALAKALWPHISGTFEEGLTGTQQNAGMGLFFISEMAKLSAGRLLVASRGAALSLEGDPEFLGENKQYFVDPRGTGYPGTLVAFEFPIASVDDYPHLIETIRERAAVRTPRRAVHRWLRYEAAPQGVLRIVLRVAVEDTTEALGYAQKTLLPRLTAREAIELDFGGISMLTQSYLHALLYEPLRVAWALRTPIYVSNAAPGVKSNLELLENYALGG